MMSGAAKLRTGQPSTDTSSSPTYIWRLAAAEPEGAMLEIICSPVGSVSKEKPTLRGQRERKRERMKCDGE
jgi:hypothetical protein